MSARGIASADIAQLCRVTEDEVQEALERARRKLEGVRAGTLA